MSTQRCKEVKVPVYIKDVFDSDERQLLILAVRQWRDSLIPVSITGQKTLYDQLDKLDKRLSMSL